MRRRIRVDVIRRAVIPKLPDDHKTASIEIYHLGAYYRARQSIIAGMGEMVERGKDGAR